MPGKERKRKIGKSLRQRYIYIYIIYIFIDSLTFIGICHDLPSFLHDVALSSVISFPDDDFSTIRSIFVEVYHLSPWPHCL